MQIFPNETSMSGIDSLFHTNSKSSGSDSFSAHLELAQDKVRHNNDKNEYSGFEALDEGPYNSKVDTDSELFAFDEVGFTKAELFQLHQDLVRAGAMPEDLDMLRQLIDKPDGANISQILESLTPNVKPVELTKEELLKLETFLTKIDPKGELKYSVGLLLENGQGLEAWSAISKQLSALDPNFNISVSKDEIAVLGKALGLSAQGQEQLLSGFGSFTFIELKPAELQKLLSPAQANLLLDNDNKDNLQKALESTLGSILQKANERFQDAKDAASLLSKNVQNSNIVIKETVTGEARTNIEQTVTGDKNGQAVMNENEQRIKNTSGQNVKTENNSNNDANGENITSEKNLQQSVVDSNAKKDNSNQPDNKDTGWENLLSKVEVQQPTTKSDTSFTNLMSLQNINDKIATENAEKHASNNSTTLSRNERSIANQVERGLLSATQNGTKRLELQLNPSDLGTINLILTSNRNGEISASIRTERTETAEVMQRQLDVIRVNLEQQGIKVDKLEVQYEPPGKQNGEQWKDLQQHNNQQEQHARQEQLERLRNLRNIRNSDANSSDNALAQNVQASVISANNASQNLYVVA